MAIDPDAALHAAQPGKFKPGAVAPPPPPPALSNTGTIADTTEQLPELRPVTPTQAPIEDPASLSDVFHATDLLARQDNPTAPQSRVRAGYAPILEALGLPPQENPAEYGATGPLGTVDLKGLAARKDSLYRRAHPDAGYLDYSSVDWRTQAQLVVDQIRLHRQKDANFLKGVPDTVDGLNAYFLEQEKAKRAGAQATLAHAPGGISSLAVELAGGVYGGFHDPVNLASLAIPGGPGKTLLQIAARDALINGAIELVEQPIVAQNRADLGEHLTLGEAATNVATAAVGGAVLGGTIHVGGKVIAATGIPAKIGELVKAMPEQARAYWGSKIGNGSQPAKDFVSNLSNSDLVRFSRDAHADRLTPDERAASNVLERSQEVGATSPYQAGAAGDGAHEQSLAAALIDLEQGQVSADEGVPTSLAGTDAGAAVAAAPERPPAALSTARRPQPSLGAAPSPPTEAAAIESFKAKTRHAESTGNDRAANPASSAEGRFQFTDGTFRDYYKRLYGKDPGAHPADALKLDPAVQERLMDALTRDDAARLESLRETVNDGNLYVMHFLGSGDGSKLFKAAPDTPIERIVSADVLAANPFLRGKSASEVIAWAHAKMGGAASSVAARPGFASTLDAASEDPRIAQLRAEAMQLDDAVIGATRLPDGSPVNLHARQVSSSSILVDADRFQFKSGGDALGVTDRLKGVEEWDPGLSGRVTLWQDREGGLFVADGHQRVALAKRIGEANKIDVPIDAMVLREADGVTAEDARTWAALKNIAEGTGSTIDAAKVARGAGVDALKRLPPKSALVRDAAALARLSDEAFGAVYNGVLPPDYAAVIGHLLPDRPEAHAAMVDLLVKLDPANRAQAESIVRQGMAAGFHVEHQDELFGARDVMSSLMLERAKVLDKGLARIRKMRLVHDTAAKEKVALEAVGSSIAAERSAKEAQANAEAAQIVSRLAFTRGPVADALNAAARKLAEGGRIGEVVDRFIADVRKLDLAAVARETPVDDGSRFLADGNGRGGDAGEAGAAVQEEPGDQGQPSLAELQRSTERFSDPDGEGVRQQAESLLHDLKADVGAGTRRDKIKAATAALEGGKPGEFRTVEPFAAEEPGYHRFRYVAKDGTAVGGNYTVDGNLIEGFNIGDTHNRAELGPAELRSLFDQLHAEHPDVRYVHGYRMSGARTEAGAGEQDLWLELTDKGIKRLDGPPATLDLGAQTDPAIAERQRQEVALRTEAPQRAAGDVDQLGEIGLPLMDKADQFGFRMDEEGGTVSAEDLLAELEADDKAIKAMKDCL